jgi:hypothetical protein
MATATMTKTPRTLVAAATSNAAGATTRGTVDLRTALPGSFLTYKITNGATGPTVQCEARILVAHDSGTTPTAASAGTVWKTVYVVGGGTENDAINEWDFEVPAGVMHLEVEFTGNTGQAVTVEAYLSEATSSVSA